MAKLQTLELPVQGMDCTECTRHVQQAIAALPGVQSAQVLLSAQKAIVQIDPAQVDLPRICQAIIAAGYTASEPAVTATAATLTPSLEATAAEFSRRVVTLLALLFGAVLFIIVLGEWLGLFAQLTQRVPFVVGLGLVLVSGWPIFANVARATLRRQVTAHTLMTLGVFAALAIGEWATAAVVVFLMRVGAYTERFTAEGARRAVKDLTALAPQLARVERNGSAVETPVGQVQPGEIVVVRPGEQIPIDGVVVAGQATVDQAAITGESMPVEVGVGAQVFAATYARLGSLRIRVVGVGSDTTFGRVIKLVEEAETHRAEVQQFADKFSAYYLPVVAGLALLTFLLRRDPLATAAVLVVACSCSIALATPIAMLATIGAGARRGLLIKGGKYLEALARADVLLIDKTGTVTLGRPQLTQITPLNGLSSDQLLALAATAEHDSEHPVAAAVRAAAHERGLSTLPPERFEALPGLGVRAVVAGAEVLLGNRRLVAGAVDQPLVDGLEAGGQTLLYLAYQGQLAGLLAVADTLRPEVPAALTAVRKMGVGQIELLTGDNERTAAALAERLGIAYRANLLPQDKIAIVQAYQAQGHTVVMVGDGVNDAPALAQADVGVAMGAAGSDIAIEAAHVALLREDWGLIPDLFASARRTMRVVKLNLAFTALYNLVGLTLAALGFLPPILAAAAQSLPDLGILANSARLLRQGEKNRQ